MESVDSDAKTLNVSEQANNLNGVLTFKHLHVISWASFCSRLIIYFTTRPVYLGRPITGGGLLTVILRRRRRLKLYISFYHHYVWSRFTYCLLTEEICLCVCVPSFSNEKVKFQVFGVTASELK